MNIAIIGSGNVGGALAQQWAKKGHEIFLGVKDISRFKGIDLLRQNHIRAFTIPEAVQKAEVVLIATPPTAIFDVLEQSGDLTGKILIDATNSVSKSPEPYKTVYHCLVDKTHGRVVKCFNTTGYENILQPEYSDGKADMFMAGDSTESKETARMLALDCGFGNCYDFGNSEKVELLEKLALSWINLAILQGQGRGIAFRVMKR
jgi:predicted dinucleotide-binding enzyme